MNPNPRLVDLGADLCVACRVVLAVPAGVLGGDGVNLRRADWDLHVRVENPDSA